MDLSGQVTLVVFTSEGREHLLSQSYPTFKSQCQYEFYETILAIDGKYNSEVIPVVDPDEVIQQYNRKGYITSINTALNAITTPYFFWLEDDFIFNKTVPIDYMLKIMKDETWAGIFLSRTAPLTATDKAHHYFDNLYSPDYGFSVAPTLCNTEHMRNAFKALYEHPKDDNTRFVGFEPFISEYFVANKFKFAVIDPDDISHVNHIGLLESTGREYHMLNSIDDNLSEINKVYLSGFGKERVITHYNKIAMLPKLWYAVFILSIQLFRNRKAYDFAFRIYISFLRKFQY